MPRRPVPPSFACLIVVGAIPVVGCAAKPGPHGAARDTPGEASADASALPSGGAEGTHEASSVVDPGALEETVEATQTRVIENATAREPASTPSADWKTLVSAVTGRSEVFVRCVGSPDACASRKPCERWQVSVVENREVELGRALRRGTREDVYRERLSPAANGRVERFCLEARACNGDMCGEGCGSSELVGLQATAEDVFVVGGDELHLSEQACRRATASSRD